jgi:hypothetical protein
MFSDDDLKGMGIGKGYTFLSYVIIFLGIALVLFLIVAFIHDAITGQLPSGGGYGDGGEYDGFGRR